MSQTSLCVSGLARRLIVGLPAAFAVCASSGAVAATVVCDLSPAAATVSTPWAFDPMPFLADDRRGIQIGAPLGERRVASGLPHDGFASSFESLDKWTLLAAWAAPNLDGLACDYAGAAGVTVPGAGWPMGASLAFGQLPPPPGPPGGNTDGGGVHPLYPALIIPLTQPLPSAAGMGIVTLAMVCVVCAARRAAAG